MSGSRLTAFVLALAGTLAGCGDEPQASPEPYDPGTLEPQIPAVVAALKSGDPEGALAELDRLAAAPDAPEGLLFWRGLALADAARPEEARAALEQELVVHPGNGQAHLLLGDALLSLGRLDEAAQQLRQAAELAPGLPGLPFLAGRVAVQAGEDEEAAQQFLLYLQDDRWSPRAAEAHHALSQIAARRGEADVARAHEEVSHAIEQAHQFLNAYRQRLQTDPDDLEAILGVGMVHLDLHRRVDPDPHQLDMAGSAFEALLTKEPGNVKALFNLGYVRILQGRFEEAQALNDRVLAVDPEHPGVLLNAGLLALQQGDDARAEERLRKAAKAGKGGPEELPALAALGDLLARLGKPDEARACYEKALALDPADPRGMAARLQALP
jgi:tetratricopeptide (TPR) repeat protein